MNRRFSADAREDALRRARLCSPFLREAIEAREDIADAFVASGAVAAVDLALTSNGSDLGASLRRQRHALALAVGLGDLAGELTLEQVTRLLSDFADRAIDEAVATAISERVPDAEPQGFAVIAMGKLGSRELNYSSDV
ncbi:MAG TPA: glutamine-synthetase adenylyltransferase, partial [Sphingomicrobium sp.]|nr:glutamine-synthetase adenylyltransferase [Sphingomicrobium sp.]